MNTQENQVPQDAEKLKEIPKWTRKYAQNRTIPVLIALAINLCLFAGIAIPSYFGAMAYRSGNLVLFWICIFVVAVAMISLALFCVPKWGGKFQRRRCLDICPGNNQEKAMGWICCCNGIWQLCFDISNIRTSWLPTD